MTRVKLPLFFDLDRPGIVPVVAGQNGPGDEANPSRRRVRDAWLDGRLGTMSPDRVDDLTAWNAIAAAYTEQAQVDSFDRFLDRYLADDLTGKRALDLGCGHGWFTNELHRRGAQVVGVDGSEALLDIARSRYPDVQFEQVDLRSGYEGEFDTVVALMVLMDLPELSRLRLRVRAGGVFVATILHPAFFLQKTVDEDGGGGYRQVRGYLENEAWWIEGFGGIGTTIGP